MTETTRKTSGSAGALPGTGGVAGDQGIAAGCAEGGAAAAVLHSPELISDQCSVKIAPADPFFSVVVNIFRN